MNRCLSVLLLLLLFTASSLAQDKPTVVKFPDAPDSADSLVRATNRATTTLTVGINSSDATLTVVSTAAFPASGLLVLSAIEVVAYSSKDATHFFISTSGRGMDGTSAQSHLIGATVDMRIVAGYHNTLSQATRNIEVKLGANTSGVGQGTPGTNRVLVGHADGTSNWSTRVPFLDTTNTFTQPIIGTNITAGTSLGVGVAADVNEFINMHITSASSAMQNAIDARIDWPSAPSFLTHFDLRASLNGGTPPAFAEMIYSSLTYNMAGTLPQATGISTGVVNQTTGVITSANVLIGALLNNSTGSVGSASLLKLYAQNATGSFTTIKGIDLSNWSNGGGTWTTSYGIYIDSTIDRGATRYAIYSLSTSPSLFSGDILFGGTTSSFPKITRSGASLGFTLADGSAGAHVTSGSLGTGSAFLSAGAFMNDDTARMQSGGFGLSNSGLVTFFTGASAGAGTVGLQLRNGSIKSQSGTGLENLLVSPLGDLTATTGTQYGIHFKDYVSNTSSGDVKFIPVAITTEIKGSLSSQTFTALQVNAINTITPSAGDAFKLIDLQLSGSSQFFVNRLGQTHVGGNFVSSTIATNPGVYLNAANSKVYIHSLGSNSPEVLGFNWNTSLSAPEATPGGRRILRLSGGGFGNAAALRAVDISMFSTSLWSATNFETHMTFSTTGLNSTTLTERVRIDSAGGVNIGGAANANASSILELTSTTKGFLPTRMTAAQRDLISSPAEGLMVYVNDVGVKKYYFYDGTGWNPLGTGTGGGGADAGLPFLLTSNSSLVTAERALVAGAGLSGTDGGANSSYTLTLNLTGLVSNQVIWDSANASRTLTAGLSGSNDPIITFSDNTVNVSTGQLQQGGVAVALQNVNVIAGAGLTGGGDLSASRTLDVGAGTGITVNANDIAINQAFTPTWTGAHVFNSSVTAGAGLTSGAAYSAFPVFSVNSSDGWGIDARIATAADNAAFYGGRFYSQVNAGANNNTIIGVKGRALLDSAATGTIGSLSGVEGSVLGQSASATISQGIAIDGLLQPGSAVVTTGYVNRADLVGGTGGMTTGVLYRARLNGNSGTITTLAGLSLDGWTNSGTVTTSYGIYIDASIDVGATKYAIYSLSTSPSLLSGNLTTTGSITAGSGSSLAGTIDLQQGTAPSLGTTAVSIYAPTSVTSYGIVLPGASATGFLLGTNASNINTLSFVSFTGTSDVVRAASPTVTTPSVSGIITFTSTAGLRSTGGAAAEPFAFDQTASLSATSGTQYGFHFKNLTSNTASGSVKFVPVAISATMSGTLATQSATALEVNFTNTIGITSADNLKLLDLQLAGSTKASVNMNAQLFLGGSLPTGQVAANTGVFLNATNSKFYIHSTSTNSPEVLGYNFENTLASPQATASGRRIFRLTGNGYDGSAFQQRAADISMFATSLWSVSNRETHITFSTTPNGSTTLTERFKIGSDGVLTAGSTTLTDTAGKILSAALNTVAVGQGGTGATTLTGIIKGNGTSAFTAATAGTDYTSPSSTESFTNKTLDVEGTGNVLTLPVKLWLPAAGCNNATAGPMWDLPTSTPAVAACVTGTNTQKGVLDFADTSGGFSAQNTLLLPGDFIGNIDADIFWTTTATSGNAKWSLSTVCTATDSTETDDGSFNTASTVTTAAPGTANRVAKSSITSLTITGCAAGEVLHVKIFRDGNDGSDTISATARLLGVQFTIRRSM